MLSRAMPRRRRLLNRGLHIQGHHSPPPSKLPDSPRTQQPQLGSYPLDADSEADTLLPIGPKAVKNLLADAPDISRSDTEHEQREERKKVHKVALANAFTLRSFRHDPALRLLLQVIQNSRFCRNNRHESLLGSRKAKHLLAIVRARFPQDSRFRPRADARSKGLPVDDAMRESQSIFLLFTEHNQCLICGQREDRTGQILEHVRAGIKHRPRHCDCRKCMRSSK